jgi:ATP-binding cassette subfamily F protein 3
MQYFAQDEAARMDPAPTVYETLASGSPNDMVPAIRNILGGFLFSGDDVNKRVRVLSGGERTRLAVARMLLIPSNTLLLDEPTNHLDLDSKEVLLDALVDYGGTLVFVSHDRYFVERLATRIIDVGHGQAIVYPGTYAEFLWHKEHQEGQVGRVGQVGQVGQAGRGGQQGLVGQAPGSKPDGQTRQKRLRPHRGEDQEIRAEVSAAARAGVPAKELAPAAIPSRGQDIRGEGLASGRAGGGAPAQLKKVDYAAKKQADAEVRRKKRELDARRAAIEALEARIAEAEKGLRELEQTMAAPGFYDDRAAAQPVVERHQALMWEVGDLMHQWEELQAAAADA